MAQCGNSHPYSLCAEVGSVGMWSLGLGLVAPSTVMWLVVLLWALLPESGAPAA